MRSLPIYRPGASYTIATGSASASAPNSITPGVEVVRLRATADCFVSFDGAASASSMFFPAGWTEYFVVSQGQTISAIQSTAAGTLYITEMSR